MHSMYSTAVFVNFTLHSITFFTTLTVNIILHICVRGHANAWSQIKSSGMDAAGFEPAGGEGNDSK